MPSAHHELDLWRRGWPALSEVAPGRARRLPHSDTDLSPDPSAAPASARGDTARAGAPHHHGAAAEAAPAAAPLAAATETRGEADTAAGAPAPRGGAGQAGRRGPPG